MQVEGARGQESTKVQHSLFSLFTVQQTHHHHHQASGWERSPSVRDEERKSKNDALIEMVPHFKY